MSEKSECSRAGGIQCEEISAVFPKDAGARHVCLHFRLYVVRDLNSGSRIGTHPHVAVVVRFTQ